MSTVCTIPAARAHLLSITDTRRLRLPLAERILYICSKTRCKRLHLLCLLRLNLPLTRLMRKSEPPRAILLPYSGGERNRTQSQRRTLGFSSPHEISFRQFEKKSVNIFTPAKSDRTRSGRTAPSPRRKQCSRAGRIGTAPPLSDRGTRRQEARSVRPCRARRALPAPP